MMMWKKLLHHSPRNIHQAVVLHTLISLAFITGQAICILISTVDNLNTTQTLEYTKDKYNAKIRK
jgi:hypothetical protein